MQSSKIPFKQINTNFLDDHSILWWGCHRWAWTHSS